MGEFDEWNDHQDWFDHPYDYARAAFEAGKAAGVEEQVRKLATGEAGLLLIPESLSFPEIDSANMAEELAEATGMTVVCGPKAVLDDVEVSRALALVTAKELDALADAMDEDIERWRGEYGPDGWDGTPAPIAVTAMHQKKLRDRAAELRGGTDD